MSTTNLTIANDYSGADIGAKINAADSALGSGSGIIVVQPGDYTLSTRVSLSANRELRFGIGTITLADSSYGSIIFNNKNRITGSGWGTVLVEKSASGNTAKSFFRDANAVASGTDADGVSDVYIGNMKLAKGSAPDFDSTVSAINLGNCHRVTVENCYLYMTSAIGIQIGGSSNLGYYPDDIWIKNNLLDQVASQMIAAVNGKRFYITHNVLRRPGQTAGPGCTMIDIEPNNAADIIEAFEVCNNILDARDGAVAGNGILVQAADATTLGPGVVSDNVIIGGVIGASPTTVISNGIYVIGGYRDVVIANNVVRRVGQQGIYMTAGAVGSPQRCLITGNQLTLCGGGGLYAGKFGGQYNTISNNKVSYAVGGSWSNAFLEDSDGDYNTFADNEFDDLSGAPGGVVIVGPHSKELRSRVGGRATPITIKTATGTVVDNTLCRPAPSGLVAQYTIADASGGVPPLGVSVGSPGGSYVAVSSERGVAIEVRSDGTTAILENDTIVASTSGAGMIRKGTTNVIAVAVSPVASGVTGLAKIVR